MNVQYWKIYLYDVDWIKSLVLCGRVLKEGEEVFYFTTLSVSKII
jgi:hypothetical protein